MEKDAELEEIEELVRAMNAACKDKLLSSVALVAMRTSLVAMQAGGASIDTAYEILRQVWHQNVMITPTNPLSDAASTGRYLQ